MRIGIVFACLFLFASTLGAAGTSATLRWTIATKKEDGSALAASAIKETLIEWRRPGSSEVAGSVRVAMPATTVVVPGLVCGDFDFSAYTVPVTGSASVSSPSARYATGLECRPNPPTGLEVS